jgi:hypothetical protein
MKTSNILKSAITALALCVTLSASAVSVFQDDFSSGTLSQWTGKNGGTNSGIIVPDPVAAGHGNVLTFTSVKAGGDLFSIASFQAGDYVLSFDYLGMPVQSTTLLPAGGYIGYQHWGGRWLAGSPSYGAPTLALTDDGQWHSYTISFNSPDAFQLMLQDFKVNTQARNAYFDNIVLNDVTHRTTRGVPDAGATSTLLGVGCLLLAGARRFFQAVR